MAAMDSTTLETEDAAAERGDARAEPSALDRDALLKRLKIWFRDDAAHSATWRSAARDDFDFVAGPGQWSAAERSSLEAQLRPVITFNRCLPMIKAVAGFEINGRHAVQFLPRGNEDTQVNEVLTGASQWMADGCDAEDEESEAFQHSVICGMGWTENRLDYEEEPAGKYVEEAIDPLEMYWDKAARKKNLADARRVWRLRRMAKSEARALFPDADDDELDASWAEGLELGNPVKTEEEKRRREENAEDPSGDRTDVSILQAQWWEREVYWLVADPVTNQKVEMSAAEFKTLQDRARKLGIPIIAAKLTRRVYRQAFIGSVILEEGPAPCRDHFSFACITGEPDHNSRTWFGLIAVMRDPQKWANKWLSQTLHIMNTNAKGGILAELDAFEDQQQAENSYAKPEAITWMKKGALSGGQGSKIMPKPAATFPAGFFNLLEFSIASIPQVTGINFEILGMRDINQPGVLEAHRKQAAMTVLATMFDSLRRFRKMVGRIRLYFVQNFLADGRIIRIMGSDGAKALPLLRDKTLGDYDVIVDDAPTSPNQKEQNWAIISGMLPAFKDQLMAQPELLLAVLEYSPLPSALIERLKQAAAKPNPEAEQAQQIAIAEKVADIAKKQADADLSKAKAGAVQATATYDIAMAQNLMEKNDGEAGSLREAVDVAHKAAQIEGERARTAKTEADTEATRAGAAHTRVKAAVEALTPIPSGAPAAGPGPTKPQGGQ
jgi:hypothetical protein